MINKKYLPLSMILLPFLAVFGIFTLVQCCSGFDDYQPDNIIEEFAEELIHYEIDRATGLPIQIDFSPMAGPEKKPLVWTDYEEDRP